MKTSRELGFTPTICVEIGIAITLLNEIADVCSQKLGMVVYCCFSALRLRSGFFSGSVFVSSIGGAADSEGVSEGVSVGVVLSDGFGVSSFVLLSSISLVISSIGFGGGVVAIVQPIHAPMAIIATNATNTGMAMIQNWTSLTHVTVSPAAPSHQG